MPQFAEAGLGDPVLCPPVCAGDPAVACTPLSPTSGQFQFLISCPRRRVMTASLHSSTVSWCPRPSATTVFRVGEQRWEGPHCRAESLGSSISCTDRQPPWTHRSARDTLVTKSPLLLSPTPKRGREPRRQGPSWNFPSPAHKPYRDFLVSSRCPCLDTHASPSLRCLFTLGLGQNPSCFLPG